MAELFELELANGIPVAGNGTVKTIGALMEDGALATIGSKEDAKSAVTDASPASLIAIMKQISATLQDLRADWPAALAAGGGLKVEGSGTPIDVAGTVAITRNLGKSISSSFTSGTLAFAAGDVVGVGGGAAPIQFTGIASGAASIKIMSASLEIARSALISGESSYRLYLYNVTPPSALADSVPFDLPLGDRAAFLGYIDLGTIVDIGSTLYCEVNNLNKVVKTASANIFGYLVTNGPYTPTAVAYKLTLGAEQL